MKDDAAEQKGHGPQNRRGIALLLTMGILLLLTLLALSFSSSQLMENEAARNFYHAARAEELALGGLEAAIAVLAQDARDNSYDHLFERWAILYPGDDGFAGNETEDADLSDIDELENGEDPAEDPMPDSRWIEEKELVVDPRTGKEVERRLGRYAVCIEDENSKVNINTAGNPDPVSPTWEHRQNMGFTTAEIDLGAIFERLGKLYSTVLNVPSRYPDNVSSETAFDVVNLRYGRPKGGLVADKSRYSPGEEQRDDNLIGQMPKILRQDINGIDDDADRLIDEPGEEVDEPGEFAPYEPMEIGTPGCLLGAGTPLGGATGVLGNDTPYLTVSHIRMAASRLTSQGNMFSIKRDDVYRALLPYITVYSQDLNRFSSDDIGSHGPRGRTSWMLRENIGRWLERGPSEIEEFLRDSRPGISYPPVLEQIAVNIYDFIDPDWIPTKYGDVVGIEPTLYLNEVEPTPPEVPGALVGIQSGGPGKESSIVRDYGEYIELWNPYDVPLDVANYYVTIGPGSRMEKVGAMAVGPTVVPPRGFFVIGDTLGDVYYIGGAPPDLDSHPPKPWPEGCNVYAPLKLAPSQKMVLEIRFGRRGGETVETSSYSVGDSQGGSTTAQKDDPRVWEWKPGRATMRAMNAGITNPGNVFSFFYMPGVRSRAGDPGYNSSDPAVLEHAGGLSTIGELGMVHRGEKWSSLNFTGNGPYPEDVRLLDLLTMPYPYRHEGLERLFGQLPAPRVVAGRININTAPPELLFGLNWSGVMDELQSYGVRANYTALINYIVTNRPYESLADVARNVAQFPSLANAPEGAREAFMRYNSNLITTKSSVFKVTVLAEVFDRRGNVASTRKLEAIVDRGYTPGSLGREGEPTPTREEQARAETARVIHFRWVTED